MPDVADHVHRGGKKHRDDSTESSRSRHDAATARQLPLADRGFDLERQTSKKLEAETVCSAKGWATCRKMCVQLQLPLRKT